MTRKLRFLLPVLLCFLLVIILPGRAGAQTATPLITLEASAGFDGYYREQSWFPVQVRISNDGGDARGRLVVRPETSGSGIPGPYSTIVDLPGGARQSATLYVTASGVVTQLRVEMIDDSGLVFASAPATLRPLQTPDRLYAVISNSVAGTVDLSTIKTGTANAYQANLTPADLPSQVGLFDAIDLIMFSDVDTGTLTVGQRTALADWVTAGGHLVVTGGANWQTTAAGITDLLPIVPDNAVVAEDLNPITRWMGSGARLEAQTLVATGDLRANAQALVSDEAGTPLVSRRTFGAGVVDYLAADPAAAPLRNWTNIADFWYALASSVDPEPSWNYGFTRWNEASSAVEILPGLDLLPDVLPLFGFLALYIALIGPLNYIVLNRINRRELAWITIPVLIVVFSVLAYVVGSNLRGNEVTLSRLSIVRSWDDVETARVETVAGLLSPRRAQYDFAIPGASLRSLPLARQLGGSLIATGTQSRAEIRQGEQFQAEAFTVDASFLGEFVATSTIAPPDIQGQVSIVDDPQIEGQQRLRGAVSNESELTLNQPVILARGASYQFEDPLEPGDVVDFELTLPGEEPPAPVLYHPSAFGALLNNSLLARLATEQSVIDLLGTERFNSNIDSPFIDDSAENLENRRRQLFLSSFIRDPYGASGRGNGVYLAGWTDASPLESELTGADWRSQDTTLYIIKLETERITNDDLILISADQFSWTLQNAVGLGEFSPFDVRLDQSEEIELRYTPVADAVLDRVEDLYLVLNNMSSGSRFLPISFWDWSARSWVNVDASGDHFRVPDHERFLGPENSVQVRLRAEETGGFMRIGQLAIEQRGYFER
ncbi:MAG: hypothetical protein IT320_25535 [Anaerolineae bacterium]|nr:hypothetical protein [Anaerolineae bacterium]